jgi:hypothetical protein
MATTVAGAVCLFGHLSVESEYQSSSSVITGRVLAAVPVPPAGPLDEGTVYTIRIDRTFKGAKHRTSKVMSQNDSGRFPMDVGKDYLLFLDLATNGPTLIDSCGNSALVTESASVIKSVEKMSRR